MTWFSWHTACCYYPIKGTYVFNRSYLKYRFTLFPVLQKAAWIHYKKKILHVCSLVWGKIQLKLYLGLLKIAVLTNV